MKSSSEQLPWPNRRHYRKTHELAPLVVKARAEGKTLQEIADSLGLTRQRIHQVVDVVQQQEIIMREWGYPFSMRASAFLSNIGAKDRNDVLNLFRLGHITPGCVRNFGHTTFREICDWLGVDSNDRRVFCPHCGKQVSLSST